MNSVTHPSDSDPYPELLSIGSKLLESMEESMLKLFSISENPEAFRFDILEVVMSSSSSISSATILASNTGTAKIAMTKWRMIEIILLISVFMVI